MEQTGTDENLSNQYYQGLAGNQTKNQGVRKIVSEGLKILVSVVRFRDPALSLSRG